MTALGASKVTKQVSRLLARKPHLEGAGRCPQDVPADVVRARMRLDDSATNSATPVELRLQRAPTN